ncbi:hypothetical protein VP1G_06238 [Cytospora mali]|uniref:2EXR domain-containing protein n=1 Tax=Cytospora mali TaxID=578113 RepID=A0A194V4X1_CYTMA|nr:hypothetical protein VP1G_06238 [Valsa mali var. pyri (nom. inval.)]
MSFSKFPLLPPEIRLLIWEMTWPDTRVMEAGYIYEADEEGDILPDGVVGLRLACPWSQWRRSGEHVERDIEDDPMDIDDQTDATAMENPVALYVCHESRTHTRKTYIDFQHAESHCESFYFHPRRDILWLCLDLGDHPEVIDTELRQGYGALIDKVENVLLPDWRWGEISMGHVNLMQALEGFKGLRRITLIINPNATPRQEAEKDMVEDLKTLGSRPWTLEYLFVRKAGQICHKPVRSLAPGTEFSASCAGCMD